MWNFARRNEHERLKSFLLEHSNDIDIEYCPVDGQGSCALLIAAGKGYYEIAELLIQYGSDTNAQNKDLESPLHRICGRGDTKMAELLLENGASINIIDDGNSTPLHILAATEFLDTLELIIQKSVPKYDKRDIGNRTAGDVAKICGNTAKCLSPKFQIRTARSQRQTNGRAKSASVFQILKSHRPRNVGVSNARNENVILS